MLRRPTFRHVALPALLLLGGAIACRTESQFGPDESSLNCTAPLRTAPAPTTPATISATVDGRPFASNFNANAGFGNAAGLVSATGCQIQIVGTELSADSVTLRQLVLNVNRFAGVGSYTLATETGSGATAPSNASLAVAAFNGGRPTVSQVYESTTSNGGTVVVSAWNPQTGRITGTFSFVGAPASGTVAAQVTSGQFDGQLVVP